MKHLHNLEGAHFSRGGVFLSCAPARSSRSAPREGHMRVPRFGCWEKWCSLESVWFGFVLLYCFSQGVPLLMRCQLFLWWCGLWSDQKGKEWVAVSEGLSSVSLSHTVDFLLSFTSHSLKPIHVAGNCLILAIHFLPCFQGKLLTDLPEGLLKEENVKYTYAVF